MIQLLQGDCLEIMPTLAPGSVDLVLCDLPYGTTACKWDMIIPFAPLWSVYSLLTKQESAIVLTASQPFTTALINSNLKHFKHCWVWNKGKAGNFATAKFAPLRVTEDVVVFAPNKLRYFPQMEQAEQRNIRPRGDVVKAGNGTQGMASGEFKVSKTHNEGQRFPKNILHFGSTEGECNQIHRVHPTQKPVALMEYLIKTYTNPGDTVLDNCMGSGTTGVACVNTGRNFIGIEKDPSYFEICKQRIEGAEVIEFAKPIHTPVETCLSHKQENCRKCNPCL